MSGNRRRNLWDGEPRLAANASVIRHEAPVRRDPNWGFVGFAPELNPPPLDPSSRVNLQEIYDQYDERRRERARARALPDDASDNEPIPLSVFNDHEATRIIFPENAQGVDAPRFRRMAMQVRQQHGGSERFDFHRINEDVDSVVVNVKIKSGEHSSSDIREFQDQYEIHHVNGSMERLREGCRAAFKQSLQVIHEIIDISGYKVFVCYQRPF
jgi:hypothetical protein